MGVVSIREGYVEFRGCLTWFRVTGELKAKNPPVVILHGGPGASHDYTDSFKNLVLGGRAVIQYDQLGCGRSTHLRQKPRRRACEPPTQRVTCPGDRGFAALDGTVGEGGEPAAPSLAA